MSYIDKKCPICGYAYRGWHNTVCCSRPACRRLWRKQNWHLQSPPRVKHCRKCGTIIPKGKHLCANCKKPTFYICTLCMKKFEKRAEGQLFCKACWEKIATKKEISKLIFDLQQYEVKIQQYELLISNYEKMMDAECKMNEELREKNVELKKSLEIFHEKFNATASTRIDSLYSKNHAMPTSDNFRNLEW